MMTPSFALAWKRFKKNKIASCCLVLLLSIFCLSMLANFIANDKPLLLRYDGQWYFPVFKTYPETEFGGVFETETLYQDPVIAAQLQAKGWVLNAPIPYAENSVNLALESPAPTAPNKLNWLGTDDQGRDVLTRLLYGLRVSLLFAAALTLCAATLGIMIGAIQGYYGGWIDLIGQRILEVWSSVPMLFSVMILVSMVQPNIYWLFFILLCFGWTRLVSLVRAEFLAARNTEYVWAAKSIGVGHVDIMFRHILPNVIHSSLSQLPIMFCANLTILTALDFLGYGLGPEMASLGELLLQARNNLHAPWIALTGFLTLAVILALLMYIADAIRDAFNPHHY